MLTLLNIKNHSEYLSMNISIHARVNVSRCFLIYLYAQPT